MEAPGYGEEEEPINTILGKVGLLFFIILNDTAVDQEVYFVTCVQALRKKSSQVFSPATGLCKFRMVCHVLKIKTMNCQIQTLRVRTFHIICQIVFVKIMTKLIAWSHHNSVKVWLRV